MRKTLLASFLLIPAAAFAFDGTDATGQYADHDSFSTAERAAISVLTNLDVVGGYPDGTFRARRTLNRAEFLKIALLSVMPERDLTGKEDWCFPDVRDEDWFSRYVCYAESAGIIEGYPDGYFRPEREVNYVEALKILAELYDYTLPASGTEWYAPYIDAAHMHDVTFTPEPRLGDAITRGQMARLAAAFRTEADGELDLYRAAERGEEIVSSSSSSSDSSSSLASSESSASSASSSASIATLPAKNDIILIDRKTPAFADGTFLQSDQEVLVREVRVTLKKKITSFSELYLIDATGKEWATLRLDLTDSSDEKWYVNIDAAAAPHITQNTPTDFGLTGKLRAWGYGGVSGEMIEVERFSLIVQSLDASSSWEILPTTSRFPKVQTAQTLLSKITNGGDVAGTLTEGANAVVGRFAFSGSLATGASMLNVERLAFTVHAVGATIASPKIGLPGGTMTPCSLVDTAITCTTIPASAQDASKGLTLELRGDVAYTGQGVHTLQILLQDPGTVDQPGAVQWFDGSTQFRWVLQSAPVAQGTNWTVVKP